MYLPETSECAPQLEFPVVSADCGVGCVSLPRFCIVGVSGLDMDVTPKPAKGAFFSGRFSTEFSSGLLEVISPPASYYPDLNNLKETFGDSKERVR